MDFHRHAYAQKRYFDLTGWHCPAKGGLRKKEMIPEQKIRDKEARHVISIELGHERESIVSQYIFR